jgi:hypothetical protein
MTKARSQKNCKDFLRGVGSDYGVIVISGQILPLTNGENRMKNLLILAALVAGLMIAAPAMAEENKRPARIEEGLKHNEKQEKRADRRAKYFAKTDKNGDGFLTKDELMAAHQARTEKMFAKLDTNKDGKLTQAEMAAGKKQMREKMKTRLNDDKESAKKQTADQPATE